MTAERIEGPTPNGGAYAILYRDSNGNPVEIVEYNAHGSERMRTYARLSTERQMIEPKRPKPSES